MTRKKTAASAVLAMPAALCATAMKTLPAEIRALDAHQAGQLMRIMACAAPAVGLIVESPRARFLEPRTLIEQPAETAKEPEQLAKRGSAAPPGDGGFGRG